MSDKLKPLSENVKRNWELWCEASYTKKMRFKREEALGAGVGLPLTVGLLVGFLTGIGTEDWVPVFCVFGMSIVVMIGTVIYLVYSYAKMEMIPERLEQLRLADVRATRLHQLYLYMIELQKKLLEQCRMDSAYRIDGQELPLGEHLDRFASQMETLETSFHDHGDLGTLLEISQIENIGSKEIVKAQLTERDSDARRRAILEVETSLRLKS